MIDKKMIIDGIDVSKCEWSGQIDLDINIICTSNSPKKCSGYCKDYPNCFYKKALKQLKRKYKENKKLKQTIDNLNAENERLKRNIYP